MHSSRMRIACLLPRVSQQALLRGVSAPDVGGVCSWRGSAPSAVGGTRFSKYYLAQTSLRAVMTVIALERRKYFYLFITDIYN